MKTATLRDLRNHFQKLEAWLEEGESIEIRRRQQTVAVLSRPAVPSPAAGFPLPDFAARRANLSTRSPLTVEQLAELHDYEMDGQQG